jgi:preprotein translocase subunit SecE
MLGTRREEENPEDLDYTEEELDDEELSEERDSLSITERRARRKAKRDTQASAEEDDEDSSGLSTTAGKGAATRRQRDVVKSREVGVQSRLESLPILGRVVTYFRGVSTEVRKVTWPTREEARRLTTIVLAVTVFFSIILGAIDLFYGWWFREGIANTTSFFVVAIPFLIVAGALSWYFVLKPEV